MCYVRFMTQEFVDQQDKAAKLFHEDLARRKHETRCIAQDPRDNARAPRGDAQDPKLYSRKEMMPLAESSKPPASFSVKRQHWVGGSGAVEEEGERSLITKHQPLLAIETSTSKMRSFGRRSYNAQVSCTFLASAPDSIPHLSTPCLGEIDFL